MFQDLRFGIRSLLKNPGFTAVAVITLALGIGANTAMFSVLYTYLFRALPYPESERIVRVFRTSTHSQTWPHSPATFLDLRERNDVFTHMVAFTGSSPHLAEPGEPAERLRGMTVTGDFFPALGVPASLGRVFADEEDKPGSNMVVVLSHRFWQQRFGADPNIVGRTLRLDGESVQVMGVMPPEFEHPLLWGSVDLWRPMAFSAEQRQNRGNNYLRAFARLKPGVNPEQAQASLVALAAAIIEEYKLNRSESLRLVPMQRMMADEIQRNVMWFTLGLAGFVLLIACANLANLQLARTSARSREFAVRAALGAARTRLLRQSMIESLLISLAGGVLSLGLGLGAIEFISRSLFADLAGAQIKLDFIVFAFALLGSVVTGMIFGAVPAWMASRSDINQVLRDSARGSTISRSYLRLRHALIIGEIAFALVLLTGAGLFLRGVHRFANLDPGWRVDGLLTARISLQGASFATEEQRRNFFSSLEERLSSLPGVEGVAISVSQPVWGFTSSGSFIVEGQPEPEQGRYPEVYFEPVSNGYFDTLKLRLIAGRLFEAEEKPGVVIVNQTLADRFWPNENPIGKRIGRPGNNPNWVEVIGVVNDLGFPGELGEPYTRFQSFRPLAHSPWGHVAISLRSAIPPESLGNSLRLAIGGLAPEIPVYQIRTARSLVDQGLGNLSLLGSLLGAFAALGLGLAAVGIYGVISYSVVQRTGEIGIRMALGAQKLDVFAMVLAKGAVLTVAGVVIGSVGAYGVSMLLQKLIPTLPTRDPGAIVIVAAVLVGVALAACYFPARRAARLDPLSALRCE